MLHIMLYTDSLAMTYEHSFAIHYFINSRAVDKSSLESMLRRGLEILNTYVPNWKEKSGEELNYLGIEHLPININAEYLLIAEFDTEWDRENCEAVPLLKRVHKIKPMPNSVIEQIREYRMQSLTIDIDSEYALNNVLKKIINSLKIDLKSIKLYKTFRGYHMRYKLPKVMSIKELIELRDRLGDDYKRVSLDKLYLQQGYDYLTNILFNAKYFYCHESSTYKYYEEQELNITDFKPTYEFILPYTVSNKLNMMYKGCRITTKEKKMLINGLILGSEAERLREEVEELYLKEDKVKGIILRHATSINLFYEHIINESRFLFDPKRNTVTVKVHPKYIPYLGRLIGKEGRNVKAMEEETKTKIRFVIDESEEDKALRLAMMLEISNEDWELFNQLGINIRETIKRIFGVSKFKIVGGMLKPVSPANLIAVPYNNKVIMIDIPHKSLFVAKYEDIKEYGLYFF